MIKKIFIISMVLLSLSGCSFKIFSDSKNISGNKSSIEASKENENWPFASKDSTTRASHNSGIYNEPFRLTLKNNNSKAKIFYTTNMDNFDIDSFNEYELPILVDRDLSIRFYSKINQKYENVQERNYKINIQQDSEDNETLNEDALYKFIYDFNITPQGRPIETAQPDAEAISEQ